MNCPRCQSNNIDSYGTCLTCGYEISPLAKELAQKLEAMRLKEEEIDQNLQSIIDVAVSRQAAPLSPPESDGASSITAADGLVFQEMDDNEPMADMFIVAGNDTPNVSEALDVSYASESEYASDTLSPKDAGNVVDAKKGADTENIVEIVETDVDKDTGNAVKTKYVAPVEYATDTEDDLDSGYADFTEDISFVANASNPSNPEGRLIFLSRTLSGLVDLFLIGMFTGIFLCLADYFTNAPMLSSVNAINYSALFLMIYLLYSIFFLGTNSQTIGMMATDLRVVGMNNECVSMSQVVRRNTAFLVSLFGFGIGLLAGVFSRKCLCLHDRLSETRVVRTF